MCVNNQAKETPTGAQEMPKAAGSDSEDDDDDNVTTTNRYEDSDVGTSAHNGTAWSQWALQNASGNDATGQGHRQVRAPPTVGSVRSDNLTINRSNFAKVKVRIHIFPPLKILHSFGFTE